MKLSYVDAFYYTQLAIWLGMGISFLIAPLAYPLLVEYGSLNLCLIFSAIGFLVAAVLWRNR